MKMENIKPVLTGKRIVLIMFLVMVIMISLSFSVFALVTVGQAGAAPTGTIFCQNEQRCKEIDEVWSSKISLKIGGEGVGKVWDFSTGGWKTFAEMYPGAGVAAPTYTSPPDTTLTGLGEGGTSSSGMGACYSQAISSSKQLAEQNLKEINFQGTPVRVHKFIAPLFEKVNQEITNAHLNYQFSNVGTWSWRCVKSPKINIVNDQTCMGSDGKVHRSKHSYGTAIDINSATNPFCSFDKNGNLIPDKDCKPGKLYDLPQEVINIFRNNDFDWGGNWEGAQDYMHFVWKGNKGDFDGDGDLEQCPSSVAATAGAKVIDKTEYDSAFITHCKAKGISPALVKAISSRESELNPLLIGPSGDVGLMQFTYNTGQNYFTTIVNCCTKSGTETTSSCVEENKAYGKEWGAGKPGVENPYKCNPTNDDRFNPELSIQAGCKLVKANYDAFKDYTFATEDDKIKFTIAAYHLGAGGVKSCIKGKELRGNNCKTDLSAQTLSWDLFSNNLPDAFYPGKTIKYKPAMDNYVLQIYSRYITYNALMQPKSFFSSSLDSPQVQYGAAISQGSKFSFVVISDTNGGEGSVEQPPAVTKAISAITQLKPSFVIMAGDMIAGGSTTTDPGTIKQMWNNFYTTVFAPITQNGIAFFPSAGNHDASFNSVLSQEYTSFWGAKSPAVSISGKLDKYYSFDYENWHFVVLYTPKSSVDQEQLNWLMQDLNNNKNKNTFVFGHIQLKQLCSESYCSGDLSPKIVDILKSNSQVKAYFHGHQQVYYKGVYNNINVISTGRLGAGAFNLIGSGTQPPTFVVVDIKGNAFAVRAVTGSAFNEVFDESKIKTVSVPGYSPSPVPQYLI